eukprot:7890772-Alexandrium_andersonii.AAC.1
MELETRRIIDSAFRATGLRIAARLLLRALCSRPWSTFRATTVDGKIHQHASNRLTAPEGA